MKYSFQRELILENINSRYDHPTAEMIYNDVVKELPTISLGTVYRNLTKLCENNDIDKLYFNSIIHYDAKRKTHQHMKCSICNQIYDIDILDLNTILSIANKNTTHNITGDSICLNGICEKCNN